MSFCFQISFSFSKKLSKINLLISWLLKVGAHLFWCAVINLEKLGCSSPVPFSTTHWSQRLDAAQGQVFTDCWVPLIQWIMLLESIKVKMSERNMHGDDLNVNFLTPNLEEMKIIQNTNVLEIKTSI